MAKLYFRYGAMGSSKTANALMVAFNFDETEHEPVVLPARSVIRAWTKRDGLCGKAPGY